MSCGEIRVFHDLNNAADGHLPDGYQPARGEPCLAATRKRPGEFPPGLPSVPLRRVWSTRLSEKRPRRTYSLTPASGNFSRSYLLNTRTA